MSITAEFEPEPETFTVTTGTSGEGTVSRDPDLESYEEGTPVTLTATETTGWIFTGWSGDASGRTNPLTVTVNEDMSITDEVEPAPEPEPGPERDTDR